MSSRVLLALPLAWALTGCREGREMPLEVGRAWTYTVRSDFITRVEPVRVLREVPVAGVRGYEIGGPLGLSQLAWKDGTLVAGRLVNAGFDPPLPLLVGGEKSARRSWSGRMDTLAGTIKSSATLVQEPEELAVGPRKLRTTRTTLTVRSGENTLEVTTWYQPGQGPVRQTQHTNGAFDVELTLISGL